MVSNLDDEQHPEQDRKISELLEDLTVLVVDDDADNLDLISFVLSGNGAQVLVADSAPKAFEIILQSKLDILISDIAMPEMDGYSLIRQIRTLKPEQGGQIPAIALTAFYFTEEERTLALSFGFQVHLSKPVDFSELIAAVLELSGRS